MSETRVIEGVARLEYDDGGSSAQIEVSDGELDVIVHSYDEVNDPAQHPFVGRLEGATVRVTVEIVAPAEPDPEPLVVRRRAAPLIYVPSSPEDAAAAAERVRERVERDMPVEQREWRRAHGL